MGGCCDLRCINCVFHDYLSYDNKGKKPERVLICDYLGYVGKKRPCLPGKECTVRVPFTPKRNVKSEKQELYRQRIRAALNGKQKQFFEDYFARSGETYYTLAARLGVAPATVLNWRYERSYAHWEELAAIGIVKPPDMPCKSD